MILHNDQLVEAIKAAIQSLPEEFEVRVGYVKPSAAYAMSFYPGARQSGPFVPVLR